MLFSPPSNEVKGQRSPGPDNVQLTREDDNTNSNEWILVNNNVKATQDNNNLFSVLDLKPGTRYVLIEACPKTIYIFHCSLQVLFENDGSQCCRIDCPRIRLHHIDLQWRHRRTRAHHTLRIQVHICVLLKYTFKSTKYLILPQIRRE